MKRVFMEEMSWLDIRTAMENGADTVLICAASHEQHGPHLAESTDYIIGKAMCEGVAGRLGNALVAPLIRPGLSVHHMNHPGSLTLRPEVFKGLVEDYVDCYVRHGFVNIVLLSSHGGNYAVLRAVAGEMQQKYPDRKIVCPLELSELFDVFAK
ncbi:MAG: creatininase family protein, partial [Clostridia bacterium]|nr:creatininase family protein [Clostridia bacterium]